MNRSRGISFSLVRQLVLDEKTKVISAIRAIEFSTEIVAQASQSSCSGTFPLA